MVLVVVHELALLLHGPFTALGHGVSGDKRTAQRMQPNAVLHQQQIRPAKIMKQVFDLDLTKAMGLLKLHVTKRLNFVQARTDFLFQPVRNLTPGVLPGQIRRRAAFIIAHVGVRTDRGERIAHQTVAQARCEHQRGLAVEGLRVDEAGHTQRIADAFF